MTRIIAGATLERPPGPKYLDALRFAELALAAPYPKAATLRRWRTELPADFEVALVVPREAMESTRGALRGDDAMESALSACMEAADALSARFVVAAPRDLTTGQRDRDLLRAWFDRWPVRDDRTIVWHPGGLWDEETADPFARKLGVLVAFDPLDRAVPSRTTVAYARLQAIGLRSRFNETMLLDVVDALEESAAERAYVAISSPKSFQEAARLQQIATAD